MAILKTKRCARCEKTKPVTEFARHRYSKDGLKSWCNECRREAKRAWIEANPEKYLEQKRRWRQRRQLRLASGKILVTPEQKEGKVVVERMRFRNGQNPHALAEAFMKEHGRAGIFYSLGPPTAREFRTLTIYATERAAERIRQSKG